MALSDVKVRSAKPEAKAYKLTDGEGMVLLVHPNGSKYWRLRYRFGGKEKMLALGKYPEVSLADARGRRDEARKLLANGVDPSENKKAVKVEHEQEVITFEVVAREWHASNQKWSASHSARVLKSLEDNLFAAIGKRNIADLKTRDLLVPIKAVESSGRLRSRCSFAAAYYRDYALCCTEWVNRLQPRSRDCWCGCYGEKTASCCSGT